MKNDLRRPTHQSLCRRSFPFVPSYQRPHRHQHSSKSDATSTCKGSTFAEIGLVFGNRVRLKLDQITRGPFLLRWRLLLGPRSRDTPYTSPIGTTCYYRFASSGYWMDGCVRCWWWLPAPVMKFPLFTSSTTPAFVLASVHPHRSFPTYSPFPNPDRGTTFAVHATCLQNRYTNTSSSLAERLSRR